MTSWQRRPTASERANRVILSAARLNVVITRSAVTVKTPSVMLSRIKGAEFFLNQNSREPVTEPDEMVPLWKILHLAGADWTYGSKGWGGENYCMFLADNDAWEHITRTSAEQADALGCPIFLNTE